MHDAVSQALFDRLREPQGLSRMVTISGAAHVAAMAIVLLVPASWFKASAPDPRNVMTISLANAPGPVSGGMTPISGRPIQRAVEEMPKVAPTRPPAPRAPEMVENVAKPKTPPKPTEKVQEAPKEARSKQPTVGTQARPGRAMAETGSTSNTVGLSTGGGNGTNAQMNMGDFCCPDYISGMIGAINRNWSSRQSMAGTTKMRFTIQRDGTITDITVAQSSGYQALDFMAQRALIALAKLPPLPEQYTNPTLTIELFFEYQR